VALPSAPPVALSVVGGERRAMRGDRGAGSILAVAIIGALAAMLTLLFPLCAVLAVKQKVAGAADAAAVAAADVAVGTLPGLPCAAAAIVAEANGAVLRSCTVSVTSATVRTQIRLLGFSVTATATAGQREEGVP
jgi:secretion/DNA translocation related TadE-like protein